MIRFCLDLILGELTVYSRILKETKISSKEKKKRSFDSILKRESR